MENDEEFASLKWYVKYCLLAKLVNNYPYFIVNNQSILYNRRTCIGGALEIF